MATAAQPILLDDSDSDVIEVLVINDAAAEELVPDRVDKTNFRPADPDTRVPRFCSDQRNVWHALTQCHNVKGLDFVKDSYEKYSS
jgi:hypothetical protein